MTTPEQMALLLSHPDAPTCSPISTPSSSTSCTRWRHQARRPAGARPGAAAHAGARAAHRRAVGDGGAAVRAARLSGAAGRAGDRTSRWPISSCRRRRQAADRHPRARRADAAGRATPTRYAIRRDLRGHRGAPPQPPVRQHAHAGRAAVPGAVAHQRCSSLPIALHHGSLDAAQRRKVEAAMADGPLRAVVATSTLDLGIDWGDVDLVIHVGAPKGASRFIQRIGRSNHRLDEPSQAHPGAVQPLRGAGMPRRARCGRGRRAGRDVLAHGRARRAGAARARHGLRGAVRAGGALSTRSSRPRPIAPLTRATFDRVLDFVATAATRSRPTSASPSCSPAPRRQAAHRASALRRSTTA